MVPQYQVHICPNVLDSLTMQSAACLQRSGNTIFDSDKDVTLKYTATDLNSVRNSRYYFISLNQKCHVQSCIDLGTCRRADLVGF